MSDKPNQARRDIKADWVSPGGVPYRQRIKDKHEDALLAGEDYSAKDGYLEPIPTTYRIEHMEPTRWDAQEGKDNVLVVRTPGRTPICRCWDVREAEKIRDALNAAETVNENGGR